SCLARSLQKKQHVFVQTRRHFGLAMESSPRKRLKRRLIFRAYEGLNSLQQNPMFECPSTRDTDRPRSESPPCEWFQHVACAFSMVSSLAIKPYRACPSAIRYFDDE